MESEELTLAELIASASMMQCSECGEVFRDPMLLPCLHSFCLECLVELLLRAGGHRDRENDGQWNESVTVREDGRSTLSPKSQRAGLLNLDGGSLQVGEALGCSDGSNSWAEEGVISRETAGSKNGRLEAPDHLVPVAEESERSTSKTDKRNASHNLRSDAAVGNQASKSARANINEDRREAASTNVGDILREIESRHRTHDHRGSNRPRRLRPLSARRGNPRKDTTCPLTTQSISPLSSASLRPPVPIEAASDGNVSTCSQVLRQNKHSTLCLVCPTCGRTVQLKADILLQDDDDENVDGGDDVHLTAGDCSLTKDSRLGATKPVFMTTNKLRMLLRKNISATLLPNHFLKSLATIHRHKNPGTEKVSIGSKEKSSGDVDSGKEGTRGDGQLLCAYCLSEGQNVDAYCLCLDCNDRMCEVCASAHRKTRVTRNHTVAALNSIRQGLFDHDLRAQDHVTCSSHQDVAVSWFCCECLTAVCKRCKADQHRAHKTTTLHDISVKLVPELSQIQRALGRRVPCLASYLDFLRQHVTQLEHKRRLVAQEIDTQAQLIHRMIDEHKQKLLTRLETACTEQNLEISAKLRAAARDMESLAKTSAFLFHLGRLGRADEIVTSYSSIVHFYRQLVNSSSSGTTMNDDWEQEDGSLTKQGESMETAGTCSASTEGVQNDASTTRDAEKNAPSSTTTALTSRLACVFTAGPCTETNMNILMGPLDLHKVPLDVEDSPQCKLPLTTLMPERLNCPRAQATFHTGTSGDRYPVYPSGLALHPRLLALVDRENAAVKIFDKSKGTFLRSIKGDGRSSLVKPFDVAFLDKTGTTLAVSDSEAGVVRVFESLTGKFIRDFAGDVRHPRGMLVLPDTGQVVVVDGHLRHLTFHDSATGEMVRRLRPTVKSYYTSNAGVKEWSSRHYNLDGDNDNTCTDSNRRRNQVAQERHTHKPNKGNTVGTTSPSEENFKSTALIDPYYIALTLSGDFAVTDQASPNLKVVSRDTGDVLSQNMDYGTGQEESLHPSGLCVDRYGQIFISDTNNSRIHLALPNGQLTGTVLLQDKRKTEQAKTALAGKSKEESTAAEVAETGNMPKDLEEADLDSDKSDISVSKPLCLAIDEDTGHLVVAQAGGEVKVVKYM